MKDCPLLRAVIAVVLAHLVAGAQDLPPPGAPPDEAPRFSRSHRPPMEGQPRGPGGPMTERWMNHLREQRPEEFEQLNRLREQDPEGFRGEMRNRFRREMLARLQREHPAIHEAIRQLPEAEREWLSNHLMPGDGPGLRREGGPGAPEFAPRDDDDVAIRDRLREYHASGDPATRERLAREMRQALRDLFVKKQAKRRAELEQLEARVREMRKMLETRDAEAESIIDSRLKELTDPQPPAPPPPAAPTA